MAFEESPFVQEYDMGYRNYEAGEWQVAKKFFERANAIFQARWDRVCSDDQQGTKSDGASIAFAQNIFYVIKFLQNYSKFQ